MHNGKLWWPLQQSHHLYDRMRRTNVRHLDGNVEGVAVRDGE